MLGEVDGGFAVAMRTLDRFRPSVGAFAVGMAIAALLVITARSAPPSYDAAASRTSSRDAWIRVAISARTCSTDC